MDRYHKRFEEANFINQPEWYKLLVRNIAGGVCGLATGLIGGLAVRLLGSYEKSNPLSLSVFITLSYDCVRLVSVGKSRKREAIVTGKSRLRLTLEDNLGFFAGNFLGYSLISVLSS